jgi:uncharacterized protein YukE
MRRFLFALALLLPLAAHAQGVDDLVARDLGGALERLARDVGRGAVERQFGRAYAADWWAAADAVHASARAQALYLAAQGPACAAIRTREGDASSAWVTCQLGIEEAVKALNADLDQIEKSLPDWERMVRELDTANTSVTPAIDAALAAIAETKRRLAEGRY